MAACPFDCLYKLRAHARPQWQLKLRGWGWHRGRKNEQALRREQGWGGAGESLHFRALKLEVGKATHLYSLR